MSPLQCRLARAALDLSIDELAQLAGVGKNTVLRLERGSNTKVNTVAKIRKTLEDYGIIFIEENGGGSGVRKKMPMKQDILNYLETEMDYWENAPDGAKKRANEFIKRFEKKCIDAGISKEIFDTRMGLKIAEFKDSSDRYHVLYELQIILEPLLEAKT